MTRGAGASAAAIASATWQASGLGPPAPSKMAVTAFSRASASALPIARGPRAGDGPRPPRPPVAALSEEEFSMIDLAGCRGPRPVSP